MRAAATEIFETAVALGGTLSGEHGIGLLRKQFMELDVGPGALAVMRAIKDAIDPLGIMNPGKVFPPRAGRGVRAVGWRRASGRTGPSRG